MRHGSVSMRYVCKRTVWSAPDTYDPPDGDTEAVLRAPAMRDLQLAIHTPAIRISLKTAVEGYVGTNLFAHNGKTGE